MRSVYGNLAKSVIRLRATPSSRRRLAGSLVPYVLFLAIIGGCTTLPQHASTSEPQRPTSDYQALIAEGHSCLSIAGAYQNAGTMRMSDGSDVEALLEWHIPERNDPQSTRMVLSEAPSSNGNGLEATMSIQRFMNGATEPPFPVAFRCSVGGHVPTGWWVKSSSYGSADDWSVSHLGWFGGGGSYGVRFRKGTDGSLIVVRFHVSYAVGALLWVVPVLAKFDSATTWYRFPPAPDQ